MRITSLKLKNFRNYSDLRHAFDKNVLFLVGPNGSGKTNFLESLRVLSLSKSFRAQRDVDLIKFEEEFARVEGEVELAKKKSTLAIIVERTGRSARKSIQINKKPARSLDLIGKMTTVLFSPDDLRLVTDSPVVRRRYLDIAICQIDPVYCQVLGEYRQVLRQRNQLLARIKDGQAESVELDFWDQKMADKGAVLVKARQELIDYYNRYLFGIYENFNEDRQKLEINYRPSVVGDDVDFTASFIRQLKERQTLDIKRVHTTMGPHRDDFGFSLDGKSLSAFGSRGEIRSAVIALKLVELEYFQEQLGERPILLLDDIFSELDKKRRASLVSVLNKQQTIVTITDLDHAEGVDISEIGIKELKK